MIRLAALWLLLGISTAAAQTALRPDQISPATPDITWAPGGTGYQIGSTVPWRSISSQTILATDFLTTDAATVIELTNNTGPITATLPAATTTGFTEGFGFAIQTGPQPATFSSSTLINGLSSIKAGPYQIIALSSHSNLWYAELGVPQPSAQTGATLLCDNMTWAATCSSSAITISGVNPASPINFTTPSTSSPVASLTATCSSGSCAGATFALGTTGTCAGAASADNTKFTLSSGGALASGSTTVNAGTYQIGVAVTLAGATNSGTCYPKTLVGAAAGAGIAYLQDKFVGNSNPGISNLSLNLPTTTTGSMFVVSLSGYSDGTILTTSATVTTTPTMTCNLATPFTLHTGTTGTPWAVIWYCPNNSGGSRTFNTSYTNNASGGTVSYPSMVVSEFSGAKTTTAADAGVGNFNNVNGLTAISVALASGGAPQAGDLVVSAVTPAASTVTSNSSTPAGFVDFSSDTAKSDLYQITTAAGVVTHTFNFAAATDATAVIAAFTHP